MRTTFTEEQLQVLQANFDVDSNPDGQDLERIAQITGNWVQFFFDFKKLWVKCIHAVIHVSSYLKSFDSIFKYKLWRNLCNLDKSDIKISFPDWPLSCIERAS